MLPNYDDGDDGGCEASSRRTFVVGGMATAAAAGIAAGAGVLPAEAAVKGAKGAAEYDLEFYLRDLPHNL